jgi:hypothetical protein
MLLPSRRPEFVYKYGRAEGIARIVQDLTFFFSPAAPQNDLYEFRARSLFTEDSDTQYRICAKRLMAEGWFTTFEEALVAARVLDPEEVAQTYNSLMPTLNAFLGEAKAHSGVTCFSSQPNNQRMWGTYGDNHAGALIHFSTDKTLSRFASHLSPVMYTDTKLPFCPSHLISETMEIDQFILAFLFCVKHMDWRDEHEWRLLLLANDEQSVDNRIVGFERDALVRVVLGPRIAKDDEVKIRDAAASHSPPIPVLKRHIDPELAYEELVGFEVIRTFEQFMYWMQRLGAGSNT